MTKTAKASKATAKGSAAKPAGWVDHPTADARAARGKAARAAQPHDSHAAWEAPADRADPVAILEAQAASRVPELIPIRYGRMKLSPFTYSGPIHRVRLRAGSMTGPAEDSNRV